VLDLSDLVASDRDMQLVGGLTSLECLLAEECWDFSDEGLAPLARLKNLRVLRLRGCEWPDQSLRHLSKLTRLERLELDLPDWHI
jgi:hypothetical protein